MSSITLSRTHQKKPKLSPTFHAISSDAIKPHAPTKKHPVLAKSRNPSDRLNELQVVNKSILKQVSQFESECQSEMNKIRNIDEQNELLAKPGAPKKQHVMEQMATLRTQVENQRTELERKERDCKDEVKKLARALKNVQNKYITLQIKYQNLAKKAVQNQKKIKRLQDDECAGSSTPLALVKERNKSLQIQLHIARTQYECEFGSAPDLPQEDTGLEPEISAPEPPEQKRFEPEITRKPEPRKPRRKPFGRRRRGMIARCL